MKKMNVRKFFLMLADAIIVALTALVSNMLLSWYGVATKQNTIGIALQPIRVVMVIGMSVLFCFFFLYVLGAYNKAWRDIRAKDIAFCALAVFLGLGTAYLFANFMSKPPTVEFMALNTVLSVGAIVLFRIILRSTVLSLMRAGSEERNEELDRTLIVGAGQAARMILQEINNAHNDPNNPANVIFPVCLVDDDPSKYHTKVMGIDVVGQTKDIPLICRQYNIELVIFAIPSCSEEQRKRIMGYCSESGCRIKTVPYLSQLFEDDDSHQILSQVKDIKIEDLLGRPPITFNKKKIRDFIYGKVCMVTGGGGSIGSELVRQIAKYHPEQIIIVDIYENNAYDIQQELYIDYGDELNLVTLIASVRDYDKMDRIFDEYRPQVVFHAAAHKHVPLMEVSPTEAVKNNIFGTLNMVNLAEKYEVEKFVMISTDKAVNPTNVMGATKRCCEMIVQLKSQQGGKTEYVTTRFGNVLGSNGSVIPLFRRQIEAGRPVTVTHPDIIRYFMTIPEAVSLVLEAGAIAKGGEIFVLDMGDPVKITTLAENLIRMYGKVPYRDVEIKFTGLRPGEKLYEELLMDEEGLQKTDNKKIFIGNQLDIDADELNQELDELHEIVETNDNDATVRKLEAMVDTFHHNAN
ncbi:MAG: polysaccharide biosynthesis protein [Ruminococcus sp.]|uniref:polysaccharide biosynthesis protein n=1 Tax=Ruminococcus sp. TaxID=41978 RepID=UPI002872DC9F|nr:nucleoside-diphosphate sugar epimerase/dehydratase [Ruminococcus sp.]MBQ3284860.1 polysaccharide biosynthesis protein [Ruminococcus sp.]